MKARIGHKQQGQFRRIAAILRGIDAKPDFGYAKRPADHEIAMPRQPSLLRYLFSQRAGWLAVYGMILLFIGLATFASVVCDTLRLQREGEETFANVLALDVVGITDGKRFTVRFAFLHDGDWFENTADVPEEVFSGLTVEDRIAVRLWGKDPTLVRLKAVPEPPMYVLFPAWVGVSLTSLIMGYWALRQPSQIFWLSRNGIPLQTKTKKRKLPATRARPLLQSGSSQAVELERRLLFPRANSPRSAALSPF